MSSTTNKFAPEVRERAVRMVLDHERDHPSRLAAVVSIDDYNTERLHSSLGYATPAAFAAELEQQRAGLTPPVASPALMRDNTGRSLVAAG